MLINKGLTDESIITQGYGWLPESINDIITFFVDLFTNLRYQDDKIHY